MYVKKITFCFTALLLIAFAFADDDRCVQEFDNAQQVMTSLESAIASRDIPSLYQGMDDLLNAGTKLNDACSNIELDFRPPQEIVYSQGCQDSIHQIEKMLKGISTLKESVDVIQKLIAFFSVFQETCLKSFNEQEEILYFVNSNIVQNDIDVITKQPIVEPFSSSFVDPTSGREQPYFETGEEFRLSMYNGFDAAILEIFPLNKKVKKETYDFLPIEVEAM